MEERQWSKSPLDSGYLLEDRRREEFGSSEWGNFEELRSVGQRMKLGFVVGRTDEPGPMTEEDNLAEVHSLVEVGHNLEEERWR